MWHTNSLLSEEFKQSKNVSFWHIILSVRVKLDNPVLKFVAKVNIFKYKGTTELLRQKTMQYNFLLSRN